MRHQHALKILGKELADLKQQLALDTSNNKSKLKVLLDSIADSIATLVRDA